MFDEVETIKNSSSVKGAIREIIKFQNGSTYDGFVVNNVREGTGKQTWIDGSVYDGQWKNNTATGKGKFNHPNGDSY